MGTSNHDDPPNLHEETTVKKIKFRISTWAKGREFMQQVAKNFQINTEEVNGDLVIINNDFNLSCHFDEQKISYLLLKIKNDDLLESAFDQLIADYKV